MEYSPLIFFLVLFLWRGVWRNIGVRRNLLKRAMQTMAGGCQSWQSVLLNVWMEVAGASFFFFFFSTVSVAKKTRSSCFKHLQMVMHQQLVSVQRSYCRGIKKTGQSWRCTANLPCRVGEHFPWKKKVLYSCRDRQDGSPVESVPCLAEDAARAGEPNAPATGKRGVRGLAVDLSRIPAASLPSVHVRVRADTAGPRVWAFKSSDHPLGRVSGGARPVYPCCPGVLASSCKSITASLASLPRPGRGRRKISWKTRASLSSFLILCPLDGGGSERRPRRGQSTISLFFSFQTPPSGVFFRVLFISGNCNTQSMLLR